jgi:hypothetical protein
MRRWSWIMLLLSVVGLSEAATVTLQWDNPSGPLTENRVHYGYTSGTYHTVIPLGVVSQASIPGLEDGRSYVFAVTAINTAGESKYSNEVQFLTSTVPQPPSLQDTTGPEVWFLVPGNGNRVARRSTIAVDVSARDDRAIVYVEIWVNGSLLCRKETFPYRCAWRVPGTRRAQYRLEAFARDLAGNVGQHHIRVTTP